MGDFYGYNSEQFIPKFDWVETLGKDLSKVPEAMQVQSDLNDGKIANTDVYQGVTETIKDVPDSEFEQAFGKPKKVFLTMAKPDKDEKPSMYFARMQLLTNDGLKALTAKKGVTATIEDIAKRNAPADQYAKNKTAATTEEATPGFTGPPRTAVMGEAPSYATPTEVMAIGQKHGVAPEALAPQVNEATERLTTQQLSGIGRDDTKLTAMQKVGGKATSGTIAGIGTLQDENQVAVNANRNETTELRLKEMEAKNDIAKVRNDISEERNHIARIRVAVAAGKATSDDSRFILESQGRLAVKKLELKMKAQQISNEITAKAGKNDPTTFLPMMSAAEEKQAKLDLEAVVSGMAELDDIGKEFKKVLSKQPGNKTDKPADSTEQGAVPKFNSPSDPAFLKLPSGSKFIDGNGVTRVKK